VRVSVRRLIRQRYAFRCGYCGTSENEVGAELTIDHFRPRSEGGTDSPENLVYCCHACNEFKGDYWQPDSVERLLHPEQDDLSQHIALATMAFSSV
jgi:5-methylcytosine-specific restriction endonuclease McrA